MGWVSNGRILSEAIPVKPDGHYLFFLSFRDNLFFFPKKNQNLLIASHLMEVSMRVKQARIYYVQL